MDLAPRQESCDPLEQHKAWSFCSSAPPVVQQPRAGAAFDAPLRALQNGYQPVSIVEHELIQHVAEGPLDQRIFQKRRRMNDSNLDKMRGLTRNSERRPPTEDHDVEFVDAAVAQLTGSCETGPTPTMNDDEHHGDITDAPASAPASPEPGPEPDAIAADDVSSGIVDDEAAVDATALHTSTTVAQPTDPDAHMRPVVDRYPSPWINGQSALNVSSRPQRGQAIDLAPQYTAAVKATSLKWRDALRMFAADNMARQPLAYRDARERSSVQAQADWTQSDIDDEHGVHEETEFTKRTQACCEVFDAKRCSGLWLAGRPAAARRPAFGNEPEPDVHRHDL